MNDACRVIEDRKGHGSRRTPATEAAGAGASRRDRDDGLAERHLVEHPGPGAGRGVGPLVVVLALVAISSLVGGPVLAGTPGAGQSPNPGREASDGTLERGADVGREETAMERSEDGRTLRLDLDAAVELAFDNNLDIEVVGYDRDMARESIVSAQGAFDPVFTIGTPTGAGIVPTGGGGFGGAPTSGGLGFTDSEEPSSSQLAGADVTSIETASMLADFGQRLPFGLRYDVSYAVNRNDSNSRFNSLNPAYSNTFSLSVVQPLMRGAGRDAAAAELRLARRNAEVSRARFRTQVETILFEVEEAYWELVFAQRNLEVEEESLELARSQLERSEAQVEVGYIPPVQVTQAEVAVAQRESQVIRARNAVESARDRLRALLGVDDLPSGWSTRIVPTEDPGFEPRTVDLVAAMAEARERRPEVRRARARIAARRVEVEEARDATLPQLDLVGGLSTNGIGGDLLIRDGFFGDVVDVEEGGYLDAADQAFGFDFLTWRVGLSLTLPLRNRRAEGDFARATLAEDKAESELERIERDVVLEVRSAVRDLETAARVVQANREARRLAERQLEIEEERFDVGLSTNFEVLEFQEDLSQARTDELRAIVDYRLAKARLARAKGTLLERFDIRLAP